MKKIDFVQPYISRTFLRNYKFHLKSKINENKHKKYDTDKNRVLKFNDKLFDEFDNISAIKEDSYDNEEEKDIRII